MTTSAPGRSLCHKELADKWAVASLVAIPFLLFWVIKPGTTSLHGDDLIQFYPLRVLVGQFLRSGHLPLWNPYIWSGTPLLAGFNAGAAYPLTWLFAIMQPSWAWATVLALTYAVAAIGFFTFMRTLGRSPWASWMGSLTFAFAGFMASQMVHVSTVEGIGWLGWVGLLVNQIARRRPWHYRLCQTAGLGLVAGLIILTGSPEPMVFGATFAAVVAAFSLTGPDADPVGGLAFYFVAAVLALLLGAIQWVPGEAFIHLSQRSHTSLRMFGSMSVPPMAGLFLLFPYIMGGYSRFLAPINYSGTFNLPEISSYVGLLPLLALLTMVPWRSAGHDRRLLWMFYTIGFVGAIMALGRYTPVIAILYHVPVYHGIRAQNRNLFMVDFALAAIFTYWLDRVRTHSLARAHRRRILWGPPGIFGVVFLVLLSVGLWVIRLRILTYMVAYIGVTVTLGVAAFAVYLWLPKLSVRRRVWLLTAFTVVDLGLFDAGQYWLNPPANTVATGSPALASQAKKVIGSSGRYGIYNPLLSDYVQMDALGQADLNLLNQLHNFQGYGSLVSGRYRAATDAHRQGTFNPRLLSTPLVSQLNVTTVFTLPEYLLKPVPSPTTAHLERAGPVSLPTTSHPWFFGRTLTLTQVRLTFTRGITVSSNGWRIGGLMARSNQIRWYQPRVSQSNRTMILSLPSRAALSGIILQIPHGLPSRSLTAAFVSANIGGVTKWLAIGGPMQGAMPFPQWRYWSQIGPFAVFRNELAHGQYWLGSPGDIRVTHATLGGQDSVAVKTARTTRLYHSEAYSPGWTATISGAGTTRIVPVQASGTIQSVTIPPGSSHVTFRYTAPGLALGGTLSLIGLVLATSMALYAKRRETLKQGV